MKLSFILILLTVLLVQVSSFGCECEKGKQFILSEGKCVGQPKEGETGYIAQCFVHIYSDQNSRWECFLCNPQYHLINDTTCEDGGVAQCFEYTKTGSTFQCKTCTTGYYLDGNECKQNPDTVQNCDTYTKTTDVKCTECKDNHYLKPTKQQCVQNPATVNGCDTYQWDGSQATCVECESGYDGLDGQTCYKIGDVIPGCVLGDLKSSGIYECYECSKGKMVEDKGSLVTDACVANPTDASQGKVENCEVYSKDSSGTVSCQKCIQDFGLTFDETCVDVGAKKIENCGEYDSDIDDDFYCDGCKDNYYGNTILKPTTCTKCPSNSKNSQASLLQTSIWVLVMVLVVVYQI